MRRSLCMVAACVLAVGLGSSQSACAADDYAPGAWRFAVTPYLWLPNVNGKMRFDLPSGGNGESQIDGSPFLNNLKFAFLMAGEARKDRWSVFTDLVYVDFSDSQSALRSVSGSGGIIDLSRDVNLDTKTSLRGWAWTTAGGYALIPGGSATLDVFGGVRYLTARASLDWSLTAAFTGPGFTVQQTGSASGSVDLLDAIVGARGKYFFRDWFFPYYLDVGTGSSKLTWQAVLGVGYTFHTWDVLFAYRHLEYQMGDKDLLQNVRFDGPALAVTFRF
ncbi:MAG TPA: hypothetical protein VLW55_03110 [Burkholderiaceae bacterium]|nr:hypothetical protein [Burkholderiaceae bacterium]